jgi:hypothetical protein
MPRRCASGVTPFLLSAGCLADESAGEGVQAGGDGLAAELLDLVA